ncbi:FAD-dependent monooxygenase [Streptomyces sp. NBC_00648]|uniref:FAD-dependent monooxygenase n=1 Tax=Streptomyces sp. NBC_00648 TaxID=2975797 RepID=UPI00324E2C9A
MTRIAIIGAGPGGSCAALEAKRQLGEHADVTVFERDPGPGGGFGVVLPPTTLARLAAAGHSWVKPLRAQVPSWNRMEIRVDGTSVVSRGHPLIAVPRAELLAAMHTAVRDAGCDLRYDSPVTAADLVDDFDLVIAADGVHSASRPGSPSSAEPEQAGEGAREEENPFAFMWMATTQPFAQLTFILRGTPWGVFTAHAYSYSATHSTFIVEAHHTAWQGLLDHHADKTHGMTPNEAIQSACAEVFAADLDGHPLSGATQNRPRAFADVALPTWIGPKTALVGDAAHTAHFSIGSGTTLAIDDAHRLISTVAAHGPGRLDEALIQYDTERRSQVEAVQEISRQSLRWWHGLEHRWGRLAPDRLAWSLITRTGLFSLDVLRSGDPELANTLLRPETVPQPLPVGAGPEIRVAAGLSRHRVRELIAVAGTGDTTVTWDSGLTAADRLALVDALQEVREPAHLRGLGRTVLRAPANERSWAESQVVAGRASDICT